MQGTSVRPEAGLTLAPGAGGIKASNYLSNPINPVNNRLNRFKASESLILILSIVFNFLIFTISILCIKRK
jgi:hypothetical protein